jgi:HSP20 family molecular chaperone IbpA
MATITTTGAPAPTRREAGGRAARTTSPRVDIYETEKAYVLLADMPGVAADGLDVQTERNTLLIHGRVERQPIPPDYQEFELADYQRAFTLTEDLDPESITATLRDGVLRVEIPKSPRMQPKKIPVKTE